MENRKGYTFVGWYIDEERTKRLNPGGILPHEMELFDKWEINTYKVEYDTQGGRNSRLNPRSVTIESGVLPLYPAIRKDKVFECWLLHGKRVDYLPEGIYENIKLVAKYKNLTKVHFEVNGGAKVEDKYCDNQNMLHKFNPPRKMGCEFLCWCLDEDCRIAFNFNQPLDSDCTLYAKWYVVPYKVTYDVQGGLPPRSNPKTYTYYDTKISLAPASKKGYEFIGWKDAHGNNRNVIPRSSIGDKHFIACFKKKKG